MEWIQERTPNLERMLKVLGAVVLRRLPKSIQSTETVFATPEAILDAVESVERFYRGTIDFEKSVYQVIPPDDFARLHELAKGWSQPIREAMLETFRFLQQLCDCPVDDVSHVQHTVDVNEIPHIDEFNTELERLI